MMKVNKEEKHAAPTLDISNSEVIGKLKFGVFNILRAVGQVSPGSLD